MSLGSNCRSGCLTRDHASWGECARSARMTVGWMTSNTGLSRVADRKSEGELAEYRDLRKQGIQPAGTTRQALEEAKRVSDTIGKPYNAEKMVPTNLLTSTSVIKSATEAGML